METLNINIGGVIIEMDKSKVSEAIEAGELKIESDKVIAKTEDTVVYKSEDFETFKKNLADDEYKKGKTAGVEIAVKEAREANGLEFEGKTIENLVESLRVKTLAEAKIEPSQKIKDLEKDKQELQGNYDKLTNQFEVFKKDISEKETTQRKNNILTSMIPDEGLKVSKDIALMALRAKSNIDIQFEGDKALIAINGELQKDDRLEPIQLTKEYVIDQLRSIDLLEKKSGGSGKGDESGGATAGSYDAFMKEMADNGKNATEVNEEMQKRIKDGTLKM